MEKAGEFVKNLLLTLMSLVKVILLSSFSVKFKNYKTVNSDEIIILGNGPSLKDSFESDLETLKNKILACVNHFCFSDKYEELKPQYYFMGAPEFWMTNPPSEVHRENRERMFSIIKEKTNWPLVIFIPYAAKKSPVWKGLFDNNPNIRICYFNNVGIEGFTNIIHTAMKMNLGMPRPHNILAIGIFLALNMGFKRLIILGADHSWHEEFRVDESNSFKVNDLHFYDSQPNVTAIKKLDGSDYRIHNFFRKLYLAFKSYHILKEYADVVNARIYNASKKSYIDAFERIKI